MTSIALPCEPDTRSRDVTMLAHDIRGALSGVAGGLALVERARLDPETRLQIERVAAAAEVLAALVAVEFGEVGPETPVAGEALDLSAFLRDLDRRWSGEAAAKGLGFVLRAVPGLPGSLAVPQVSLLRVLGNLISNAIKFTPSGSVELSVRREANEGVAFVLRDHGPGLDGHAPEQLFEYGFHLGGLQGGQGIGLTIAKHLSDRMGAEIELADHADGGLEARLRIPPRLCLDMTEGAETREKGAPDLGGARVLLAEDNPTNQMVATQMLAALNASVAVAGDGLEALALFEREQFDIVVVDIEMPRMSGLEVIRAIRARSDRLARIPIVALTAYAMQEHRLRIAEAGADGLISKPIFSTEAFGRGVAQHLRTRRTQSEPEAISPGDGPTIDLETFRSLADTIGPEMMNELFDRIVADLESARETLAAALEPIDAASIRTSSHILISVAGAFGAARLRGRAADLNALAHADAGLELAEKVRACLAEIEPALNFARTQRTLC